MGPATALRKIISTRRSASEQKERLLMKRENNSIFRKTSSKATAQQLDMQTLGVATALSEDTASVASKTANLIELLEFHHDEAMVPIIEGLANIKELYKKENEIAQMKLVTEELKEFYEDQLAEKDAVIQQTVDELKRTRQEVVEVTADLLSVTEQELSATRQALASKDADLIRTQIVLLEIKEKLNATSVSLIRHQHKLYEMEEQQANAAQQPIVWFGKSIVGFFEI